MASVGRLFGNSHPNRITFCWGRRQLRPSKPPVAGGVGYGTRPSSRPADCPSKRVLDGLWMGMDGLLDGNGWASPPNQSVFGWGMVGDLDGRFQPMAWSPVPPVSARVHVTRRRDSV